MPHLSPISWLLLPMTIWFMLMSISISFWFSYSPTFPTYSPSINSSLSTLWNWS